MSNVRQGLKHLFELHREFLFPVKRVRKARPERGVQNKSYIIVSFFYSFYELLIHFFLIHLFIGFSKYSKQNALKISAVVK